MPSPLKETEAHLLTAVVEARRPDLMHVVEDMRLGRRLSIPDAEALQDTLAEALMSEGTDPELGVVNPYGVQLDRLIDRIADLSEINAR